MATILVADDSPVQLLTCRHILSRSGAHEVLTATDGQDALAILRGRNVDVLIADIVMPGLTGFELLDAVRHTSGLRDLPVILLTGLAEAEQALGRQAATAAAVLSKPVSSWTLLDTVRQALGEQL